MDPLSDEYPSTSPYAYVENNPIMFIDPNGMSKDGFTVDKEGNMNRIDDTGGRDYDVLYTEEEYDLAREYTRVTGEKNSYGNPEPYNQVRLPKGVIQNMQSYPFIILDIDHWTGDILSKKKKYRMVFQLNSFKKGNEIFEFLADNTIIEWALTKYLADGQEKAILVTSQQETRISMNNQMKDFYFGLNKRYGFISNTHNHPNGSTNASERIEMGKRVGGDKFFYDKVIKDSPSCKFYIYISKGKYHLKKPPNY